MDRVAFRELLIRYTSGSATAAERSMIDHWYELLYNNELPSLQQSELDNIEQEMWVFIEKEGNLAEPVVVYRSKRMKRLIYFAAAAVIICLVISGWLVFFNAASTMSYETSRQKDQLAETVNRTTIPQRINLEDGSYILLEPASTISYAKHFDTDKREVYLEGSAFFQVAKDATRPFFVYTSEVVTKVLGTSFDVKAFPNDNTIQVQVHTGKVTVYKRKNGAHEQELAKVNATIITPNQQLLFNRQQASFTRSVTALPQVINIPVNKNNIPFAFTDAPATEVLMALQKAYGITIIYDEEQMSHCSFTGAFTNESFFDRINLLCKAIESTYEQTDGQVIITGSTVKD
ncbi:anti-FecI sigma factor, FecR [Niastella koreensis GR20-10]|uniref:Anti-FecI sigma factor, FecR n=2 Tax=Niastella koreensis TaxID=354356 RepID=G8TR45_NIAKG|nr:FecR family protein [Niastella koreensis]AEV98959.1 anti-FecI sigma factor, FecR [Niastella koreensis GR20-10]